MIIKKVNPQEGRKKGNVELWMAELEQKMFDTVKQQYDDSFQDYCLKPRHRWVLDWPGQIIIAVDCTMWTKQVEDAIEGRNNLNIDKYQNQMNEELNEIINLIRGELTFLQRQTLGALTVISVHARDIVNLLVEKSIQFTDEFDWISQLRYYHNENHSLRVNIVNSSLDYMYEYIGNSTRLVMTPLTDRCYRTMISAILLIYGGAPEGPAGTGKTETVKDISKAIATQCVVFNCSDGLDYLAMAKFFKGLAASGAWSCFDEFNRIELEVLSVIAQQILTIQKAKREGLKNFVFEGGNCALLPSCNVFITMNPGYAGRSELPDNLKALFRPCAMMVPDYAMIAEIMFYSYGYSNARLMARKLVRVLRLSSEQLSSQDHYDYGMRAVKSILLAAGNLRRISPKESEEILTLRAICDVNVPKFTTNDLPLFEGILSDLFPNAKLMDNSQGDLKESIKNYCKINNLQAIKAFIEKIFQLYNTTVVRHGLMMVGEAGSGKTTVLNTLCGSLNSLKDTNEYKGGCRIHTINPKSIT